MENAGSGSALCVLKGSDAVFDRRVGAEQLADATGNAHGSHTLGQLSWSHPSVSTWYKNAKGRIVTNQPWSLLDYWRLTHEAKLADYHLVG